MPEATYTWDQRANNGYGSYRNDQTGRFEKHSKIREDFDKYIANSNAKFKDISLGLQEGRISLPDWQLQMRKAILEVHGNAALDVVGGRDQMTPSKWGSLGAIVKKEYQALDNFANDISTGKQKLNGQMIYRSTMYGGAAETTRHIYDRQSASSSGWNEERNILESGAKHCNGCIEESNKGWVPIGDLVLIGNRTCLKNDRCSIVYRNTFTGEVLN